MMLSPREHEVLNLIFRGMTNKEIAYELHISYKTVEVHTYNICQKIGVSRRCAIPYRALESGLVQPPEFAL